MKIESADGQEGYLIWCGGDRYVFRIYTNAPNDFVDYDLRHSDMRVVIKDSDDSSTQMKTVHVLITALIPWESGHNGHV